MPVGIRETLKHVRAAYPGNTEILRDVVHVEIWQYAMGRFAEGHLLSDIYDEVAKEVNAKTEQDEDRLLEIILTASREWKDMIPGARMVVMSNGRI